MLLPEASGDIRSSKLQRGFANHAIWISILNISFPFPAVPALSWSQTAVSGGVENHYSYLALNAMILSQCGASWNSEERFTSTQVLI